jgi:hypothetical protein
MRNFVFWAIMVSLEKKHMIFVFELNFHNFPKNEVDIDQVAYYYIVTIRIDFF